MNTQIKIQHTEYRKIATKRRQGETLDSIAKTYNVTRERIRQILRDHFPEITAVTAGGTRKKIFDQKREKETKLCACGCGTTISAWTGEGQGWRPARNYVSGHQGRNRVPYKRTPESLAKSSFAKKRDWAAGKYDNKIRKDTIIMRHKLWKILRRYPEGLTIKKIVEMTGIKKTTLSRWIKVQQYIKLDAHRGEGQGHPYIIKLDKEPPINLEDEMCPPHLNLDTREGND